MVLTRNTKGKRFLVRNSFTKPPRGKNGFNPVRTRTTTTPLCMKNHTHYGTVRNQKTRVMCFLVPVFIPHLLSLIILFFVTFCEGGKVCILREREVFVLFHFG